ncbi:MAG: LptE family protein [Rikenellaceae bacterium]
MTKFIRFISVIIVALTLHSCTVKYSFTGASIAPDAQTVSITSFENVATMVTPTLASLMTEELQDMFSRQTRLSLVREDGDLSFEGEITNYVSSPIAVTGDEYASMNRLTITVKVRFENKIEPQYNFNKSFSAYEDFDATQLLTEIESTLLPQIVEKLAEDIFNAAVSNW